MIHTSSIHVAACHRRRRRRLMHPSQPSRRPLASPSSPRQRIIPSQWAMGQRRTPSRREKRLGAKSSPSVARTKRKDDSAQAGTQLAPQLTFSPTWARRHHHLTTHTSSSRMLSSSFRARSATSRDAASIRSDIPTRRFRDPVPGPPLLPLNPTCIGVLGSALTCDETPTALKPPLTCACPVMYVRTNFAAGSQKAVTQ